MIILWSLSPIFGCACVVNGAKNIIDNKGRPLGNWAVVGIGIGLVILSPLLVPCGILGLPLLAYHKMYPEEYLV